VIVEAQQVALETPVAILRLANSPPDLCVTIQTMPAAKTVNSLAQPQSVERPWTSLVIPSNIVPATLLVVLPMLPPPMARLAGMGSSAREALVRREIFNVNRLSMEVPGLVTILLVC
jgi:hypothetical protein